MDPTNNYCATGAADALIAIWDLTELVAIKSFSKENSVRQLSFSHDGRYLAAASEESRFDIFDVHNNQEVWKHDCNGA
jgi:THO complex subunit 3